MRKEYTPKGRAVKLLACTAADPMREIDSREAAEIMGCDVRAVGGFMNRPLVHQLVFMRKVGRRVVFRGSSYLAEERQTGGGRAKRERSAKVANGWLTDPDDIRIGKVVPGWSPPKMVCSRPGV